MTAENQYACHDLSVWNKRQKSHLISQNVFLQSIIYPSQKKKKIIGTSSILAWGKSRVLPTDPLVTLGILLCKIARKTEPNVPLGQLLLELRCHASQILERRSKFWPLDQRLHFKRGCHLDREHLGNLLQSPPQGLLAFQYGGGGRRENSRNPGTRNALDNIDLNQMSHRYVSSVLQNDWNDVIFELVWVIKRSVLSFPVYITKKMFNL